MRMKLVLTLAVMIMGAIVYTDIAGAAGKGVVHKHTSYSDAFLSNSYIIEGETGLVVIDPPFTVSSSNSLNLQIKHLKKPVLAIISTHHHPDHRWGAKIVAGGNTELPYYAEEGVVQWATDTDKPKYEFWSGIYGDDVPADRMLPNKPVKDGAQMEIDGIKYQVGITGEDESHHGTHWIVTMPNGNVYAFIGDTAMPDFHGWLADGHTKAWIENAKSLQAKLSGLGVKRVFVGHGNSGGVEVFDWQIKYIEAYWKNLRELAADGNLTDADKGELTKRMIDFADTEIESGLVGFSADTVVKELGLF